MLQVIGYPGARKKKKYQRPHENDVINEKSKTTFNSMPFASPAIVKEKKNDGRRKLKCKQVDFTSHLLLASVFQPPATAHAAHQAPMRIKRAPYVSAPNNAKTPF